MTLIHTNLEVEIIMKFIKTTMVMEISGNVRIGRVKADGRIPVCT